MPSLELSQLAEAFSAALRRTTPPAPSTLATEHISLERVSRGLQTLLPAGFELHTIIEQCRSQLEIIVTFLATLELVRSGAARVVQTGQFSPIRVEAYHV